MVLENETEDAKIEASEAPSVLEVPVKEEEVKEIVSEVVSKPVLEEPVERLAEIK